MKYLLILLIFLGSAGCQRETVNFSNSLDVVEQNQSLIKNGQEIKQDILDIQEIQNQHNQETEVAETGDQQYDNITIEQLENNIASQNKSKTTGELVIPTTFNLPIQFAPQSPFAVWDDLHQEACEEAAMIMVAKYLKDENLDKQIMEDEIQALIKWESENGYKVDVTAQETVEIVRDYFGLKSEVSNEVTIDRIKKELALGNLIITPHAGRELGNPYYRQPGPLYHFLVIRGWTESEFITNDPGTKRGEGYKYKFDKIIDTVHDWNNGEVETGERVMVIVNR